jgi:hypothetical protein
VNLSALGSNPLGLVFLFVYGCLFVIQFLTLIWHRAVTFLQLIAGVHKPWGRAQSDYDDYDHLLPQRPNGQLQNGEVAGNVGNTGNGSAIVSRVTDRRSAIN